MGGKGRNYRDGGWGIDIRSTRSIVDNTIQESGYRFDYREYI